MSSGLVFGGNVHRKLTPTISSGVAYTANDQVGGLLEIEVGPSQSITLQCLSVADEIGQSATLEFFFFNDDPLETSVDNGALTLPASANTKREGNLQIPAALYVATAKQGGGLMSEASLKNIGLKMQSNANGKLYCLARTTGTPTFTGTTQLTFSVAFFIDGTRV